MKTILTSAQTTVLLSALLAISCNKIERVEVAALQCDSISRSLTPGDVGRRPNQFVGECIVWAGKVTKIEESQQSAIEVPGRYMYVGNAIVEIQVLPSGRIADNETLGDRVEEDIPVRCIAGRRVSGIQVDDVVWFTGKIIAETEMESLSLKKRIRKAPVVGLLRIEKTRPDSASSN